MNTCETCAWWERLGESYGEIIGECRRRSPVVIRRDQYRDRGWPQTYARDWCAEHSTTITQKPASEVD
jgi:hypothetical protein